LEIELGFAPNQEICSGSGEGQRRPQRAGVEGLSQGDKSLLEAVPAEALVGLARPLVPCFFGPSAGTFTSPMPMQFLHKSPLGNLPKPKQFGHLVVFVTLMPNKKAIANPTIVRCAAECGQPFYTELHGSRAL
jgi:hypothetical protein